MLAFFDKHVKIQLTLLFFWEIMLPLSQYKKYTKILILILPHHFFLSITKTERKARINEYKEQTRTKHE